MAKDELLFTIPNNRSSTIRLFSLPRLGGRGQKSFLPELDVPTIEKQEDVEAQQIGRIRRQIGDHAGDEEVARSVWTLKQKFPTATIPELLAYNWLERNRYGFWYQVEMLGGRFRGGLIPDFVIFNSGRGLAWLVQGEYYHSERFQAAHSQQNRDINAELEIIGKYVAGVRVDTVVTLREEDIYDRRPDVFRLAAAGQRMSV